MDFRLVSLILLIHISGSLTLDHLSVSCKDICALSETTVQLRCSYSNVNIFNNIKNGFWFSQKQSSNWRKNDEPEDLTLDSEYSGRVEQDFGNGHLTLTISDLRERDSGEYQIMFIMKDGVKRLSSATVTLTVTDLQVRMNPVSTDPRVQRVELTCDTSCDLTITPQNYYWKMNGQYKDIYKSRIITVPIEADSSYSCFLTTDLKNSSSPVCVSKSDCWNVTYTSRRVCALLGSTVDISCTYSHPSGYTVNKTFWHYVKPGDFKDLREEHQFSGRVEYVGNTLRIKELKSSDSGEYRFRIITNTTGGAYSGSPGVILTVTDSTVTSSPNIISERQDVILSCSSECTLNDKHTFIWKKNGQQVTDGFTKANKLYLNSVSNEEFQKYSCAVSIGEIQIQTPANTALKNTLIILSVFLILALIGVLWYRMRRNNSSQQHDDTKDDVQFGSATLYENNASLSTVCTKQDNRKEQDVQYSAIHFKKSPVTDTSLAPSAVDSTSDNVYYSSVNFSRPPV